MSLNGKHVKTDVLIVGAGLSGAACAKRLVDAGYETVVMEKKKLPRYKICSGILSPRGHRFLLENFGPLPPDILHKPALCRGVKFHFPSMLSMEIDFDGGATPHLNRKYSDYWVIKKSGALVQDETKFIGLEDKGSHVEVLGRKAGEEIRYRARTVIGADGPYSRVIRSIYPGYDKQVPWFIVGQRFHDIIECPLSDEYFHFWFHPDLGHYTWRHARDGQQIVGVVFLKGDSFNRRHQRIIRYLNEKHNVKLAPCNGGDACLENFGISLTNRYVFGKSNVLVTGQAAGFLNMMAEGMSCALHSGAIAGEATIEAFRQNRPIQKVYRAMIASEVKRCTDQWNPFRIVFDRPHEAEFWGPFKEHGLRDRTRIISEIARFIGIYSPFNWGRLIIREAIYRCFKGRYSSSRWI